jgi:hypothetical protein
MPSWFDQLKQRILGPGAAPAEPIDEAPSPSSYRDIPDRTAAAPKPTLSLVNSLWRLGPFVVLGVGATMTIFAERIWPWSMLGFLLLASAPILFLLRRIEDLLRELIEINKMKRPR